MSRELKNRTARLVLRLFLLPACRISPMARQNPAEPWFLLLQAPTASPGPLPTRMEVSYLHHGLLRLADRDEGRNITAPGIAGD